jgi:preprotein translocase subunit YajC
VKRLWYKAKSSVWSLVLLLAMALGLVWFIYSIIRPTKNKTEFLENVNSAIKENEIRATLEKDKIGAIKKIYDQKLKETKKIEDRDERLKALIRLHEELDL